MTSIYSVTLSDFPKINDSALSSQSDFSYFELLISSTFKVTLPGVKGVRCSFSFLKTLCVQVMTVYVTMEYFNTIIILRVEKVIIFENVYMY